MSQIQKNYQGRHWQEPGGGILLAISYILQNKMGYVANHPTLTLNSLPLVQDLHIYQLRRLIVLILLLWDNTMLNTANSLHDYIWYPLKFMDAAPCNSCKDC